MIKKLLLLLLLFPFYAIANSPIKLIIWAKDGTRVAYALTEEPKVKFTENSMVISTTKVEVDYPLHSMERFTYGDEVTTITDISTDKFSFKWDGKSLLFSALRPNSTVCIYSLSGMLLIRKTIQQGGEYICPIDDLANGVYMIKVNNITYKFSKR